MSAGRPASAVDTDPSPVLWTDNSQESRDAIRVLKEERVKFVEVRNPPDARGRRVPQLLTPLGDYPGLDLIRWYAIRYSRRNGG